MSRILRRPMFRGGRVDSRGKGIASGLSYNKGGRVGYDNGGGVFPVGGKMHRFSESPLGGGIMYGIPGALADFFYTPANQIGRMFGFNPGWSARKDIREQKDYLFGEDREGRMTDEEVDVSNFFLPFSAKSWKDEVADQKEKEKKEEGPSTAEIIAQIKAEEKAKRDALIKEYTKEDTPDEAAAEIEKKKEIFQKAYGSGIADDASNMLLNFAGKALKEGATTKSAFGEFFEEEGKRPSERKKYKDAATTAAINAYLTGQKTLAETEAFMRRTNYQLTEADKLKKAKPPFMEGLTVQAKAEGKSVKNEGVISRQIVSTYGPGKDGGSLPEKVEDFVEGMFYTGVDPNDKNVTLVYEIVEGEPVIRHRIR